MTIVDPSEIKMDDLRNRNPIIRLKSKPMSKTVTAHSLPIKPRQTLEFPIYTQFLDAHLDIRHNNCLLWTLQDTEADTSKEKVEIIMVRIDCALTPVNARYVGNFKDNGGAQHVFVIREAEKLFQTPTTK